MSLAGVGIWRWCFVFHPIVFSGPFLPCRLGGVSSLYNGLYLSSRGFVVGQSIIVSRRPLLRRWPAGASLSGGRGFVVGQKLNAILPEYVIFCVGRLTRVLFFAVPTPRRQ